MKIAVFLLSFALGMAVFALVQERKQRDAYVHVIEKLYSELYDCKWRKR